MPVALAPLVGIAVKYGTVALAGYALARQVGVGRTDQRAHDALDDLPEGATLHIPRDRQDSEHSLTGTGRLRRVFRVAGARAGWELDAAVIGRLRLRRMGGFRRA